MARVTKTDHTGAAVASILNQGQTYRERMAGNRSLPNHLNNHVKAIKEMEAKNREAKENERPPPEPWKMEKFKNVQSRVWQNKGSGSFSEGTASNRPGSGHLNSSREGSRSNSAKEQRREFLRRGANEVLQQKQKDIRVQRAQEVGKESDGDYAQAKEIKKMAVPRHTEINTLAERSDRNFISSNRAENIQAAPKKVKDEPVDVKHTSFGKVPAYLEQRKEQWQRAEQERLANMPDPDCPPGMVLMPEEERLETLRILAQNEKEVRDQLDRMPLKIEIPSQVRKQKALDDKLKEIEEAKKIFNRPKVYVADR